MGGRVGSKCNDVCDVSVCQHHMPGYGVLCCMHCRSLLTSIQYIHQYKMCIHVSVCVHIQQRTSAQHPSPFLPPCLPLAAAALKAKLKKLVRQAQKEEDEANGPDSDDEGGEDDDEDGEGEEDSDDEEGDSEDSDDIDPSDPTYALPGPVMPACYAEALAQVSG